MNKHDINSLKHNYVKENVLFCQKYVEFTISVQNIAAVNKLGPKI